MKHSVYWFLLSSGLIASSSLGFTAPVEETLNASNSYDGNNATAEFQPQEKTDATGTNYTCSGDISIAYAGKTTPLTTSCFSQTQGELSFTGTGNSLSFDNIIATAKPAAIEVATAAKNLTIQGFSLFSCSSCAPDITGNGAISSGGAANFTNNAKILFDSNCSSAAGGAISCQGFTLTGTSGSANFTNNQSADNGGVISSTTAANTIQNNTGKIVFSGNTSQKSGGAFYSDFATTISDNKDLVFSGNSTTGAANSAGGAIYCVNTTGITLTLTGNGNLLFTNNVAFTSGGAIAADKLIMTSGGPTIFSKNSVTKPSGPTGLKGGAISIKDGGECSLTADLGDIIFEGNTYQSPDKILSNSIGIGINSKFLKLSAKEGFGVYFYDPITNTGGDPTTALELNKADGITTYTGKIVFSGEKLTAAQKAIPENVSSSFSQPITLAAGSLILKDGVLVEAKQISQTAGSVVVMDVGTTLQTVATTGADITLDNLEVNIAPLGEGATSAKIATSVAGKNITISNLKLVNSDGNTYENAAFSTTKPFDSAVSVITGTGGTATIPVDNVTGYVPPTHYGFQGNWTVSWTQGATTADQQATFTWKQTGYIPNPERLGPLVPNTLWGSFMDIRSLQNLMEVSVHGADYDRGFWASGLANFLHRSSTPTRRKFRHTSAGYVLGGLLKTASEDTFSAAFCQLFGNDKDYFVAKNNSDIYAGSLYYQHTSFWKTWEKLLQNTLGVDAPLVFDAQLSYSHTSNKMKTNMTTLYAPRNVVFPEIKGNWGNDCFAAALGATLPIDSLSVLFFDTFAPFVKLQLVYAHQEDFKENNTQEGRSFGSSHLTNLSMPIGVKLERFSNEDSSYHVVLTYSPDIARTNPDCTTSLLTSPATALWTTKATNLARQSFIVRAGNHLALSQTLEIFSQFGFELRNHSRNYNVDLGSKVQF
ncbi:autotransporter domain-containing protein [Chlamydia vaughanii]|uniref:autotransporter domain-containing protein n=1 Tax=Chlamydia vaughanii TaxID=3112552 RepID=UPI0032B15C60